MTSKNKELKTLCHYYFDLYVTSTLRAPEDKKHYQKEKRKAYHKLAQELKTDAYKCHFGNMHTVEELECALAILKGWTGLIDTDKTSKLIGRFEVDKERE